jgi:protein MpaA
MATWRRRPAGPKLRPWLELNRRALTVLFCLAGIAAAVGVGVAVARPDRSPPAAPAASADLVRRNFVLGHSVRGRPIEATEVGDPNGRRVLVVGAIHGDESAGIPVARRLARGNGRAGVDLWVLSDLNPDGVVAGTRQNAHRVDLNRNFPWRWRPIGRPGDQQYSGTRALSEPETRIARDLILRVRPVISIWFHQPVGVIDRSGGDVRIERRFSQLSGLPLRRLTRYPGGATNWQNDRFDGTTSFVVELPSGRLSKREVARFTRAVQAIGR